MIDFWFRMLVKVMQKTRTSCEVQITCMLQQQFDIHCKFHKKMRFPLAPLFLRFVVDLQEIAFVVRDPDPK